MGNDQLVFYPFPGNSRKKIFFIRRTVYPDMAVFECGGKFAQGQQKICISLVLIGLLESLSEIGFPIRFGYVKVGVKMLENIPGND